MKIKQLLGMKALDVNANEVGKIDDAEFDPVEGQITAMTIILKKNFISSDNFQAVLGASFLFIRQLHIISVQVFQIYIITNRGRQL